MTHDNPFADLAALGDFDAELAAPPKQEQDRVQRALERGGLVEASTVYSQATGKATTAMREKVKCPKCAGTGVWRGGWSSGQCFACKGKGYQLRAPGYAENKAKREAAKARKILREQGELAERKAAFGEAHPQIMAALTEYATQQRYRSEFMDSLWAKFKRTGELSEGQIAAIQRGIEKRNAARAERQQAPVEFFPRIEKLVRVENLKLRLGKCVVTMFQSGAVGVVGPEYGMGTFGIIEAGGMLRRFSKMTDEVHALLQDVETRGIEAVKEIGLATGRCCICGRTLTDEHSIKNGIGPICEKKAGGL